MIQPLIACIKCCRPKTITIHSSYVRETSSHVCLSSSFLTFEILFKVIPCHVAPNTQTRVNILETVRDRTIVSVER